MSNPQPPALKEGVDYYIDEQGRYVFTRHYLLARGECCKNKCRHCPYGCGPGLPDPTVLGLPKRH